MAVDTRNKRAAILGTFGRPMVLAPNPDGDLVGVDRQQVAGLYPLSTVIAGGYVFTVAARTRTFVVPERVE